MTDIKFSVSLRYGTARHDGTEDAPSAESAACLFLESINPNTLEVVRVSASEISDKVVSIPPRPPTRHYEQCFRRIDGEWSTRPLWTIWFASDTGLRSVGGGATWEPDPRTAATRAATGLSDRDHAKVICVVQSLDNPDAEPNLYVYEYDEKVRGWGAAPAPKPSPDAGGIWLNDHRIEMYEDAAEQRRRQSGFFMQFPIKESDRDGGMWLADDAKADLMEMQPPRPEPVKAIAAEHAYATFAGLARAPAPDPQSDVPTQFNITVGAATLLVDANLAADPTGAEQITAALKLSHRRGHRWFAKDREPANAATTMYAEDAAQLRSIGWRKKTSPYAGDAVEALHLIGAAARLAGGTTFAEPAVPDDRVMGFLCYLVQAGVMLAERELAIGPLLTLAEKWAHGEECPLNLAASMADLATIASAGVNRKADAVSTAEGRDGDRRAWFEAIGILTTAVIKDGETYVGTGYRKPWPDGVTLSGMYLAAVDFVIGGGIG